MTLSIFDPSLCCFSPIHLVYAACWNFTLTGPYTIIVTELWVYMLHVAVIHGVWHD